MRGWRPALAAALALTAMPLAAKRPPQAAFAEPGDIIAAEGNFTHLAAAKGLKAAIRATAAADAQIFAPKLMRVSEFATPDTAGPWHTRELWMSCDGSVAVTHGEWQPAPAAKSGANGWYVTVWKRQKGGAYKWVLEEGGPLAKPLPESDMIAAGVADCPARRPRGAAPATVVESGKGAADYQSGHADDGTLEWATDIAGDGSRSFAVRIKQDGMLHEVLSTTAPGG